MKKIILLLMFIVLLCGCSNKGETNNASAEIAPPVTVNYAADSTLNGYKRPEAEQKVFDESPLYYGNLNSKKFHLSTCVFAEDIKEKNRVITRDREELISEKYVPCRFCNP